MAKRRKRSDTGPPGRTYPGIAPADPYGPDARVQRERRTVQEEIVDMSEKGIPRNPFAEHPDPYEVKP